jgi:hypothetical protein
MCICIVFHCTKLQELKCKDIHLQISTLDNVMSFCMYAHILDSAAAKISHLEDAVGSRIEEEGHALAQAVAEHVLMCFRSRDPAISLEPVVQGPAEEPAGAAAAGVEDAACAIADRFKREPKDS